MKAFLSFFALIIFSLAQQHPIPLPSLNLSNVNGIWYVNAYFNPNINASQLGVVSCMILDFEIDSDVVNSTSYINTDTNQSMYKNINLYPQTPNSVWENIIDESEMDWIMIDPINGEWATWVEGTYEQGMIISRNLTLSNAIIQSQLALMKLEGYPVNSSNVYIGSNNGCYYETETINNL